MRHQPHEPGFYYSAGVYYKEGLHANTPIGYGLVVIGVGFVRVSLRSPCPGIRRKVMNVFGSIPTAAGATTEVAPVFQDSQPLRLAQA